MSCRQYIHKIFNDEKEGWGERMVMMMAMETIGGDGDYGIRMTIILVFLKI